MSTLNEASILYLDDVMDHLKVKEEFFRSKGIELITTNSVNEAEDKIRNSKIDIFLSDLRLNEINYPHPGTYLLNKIRPKNAFIFLGLLTAFQGDLKESDRIALEDNVIEIYNKDTNNEAFFSNLENDFNIFQNYHKNNLISNSSTIESQFYSKYCNVTIEHLKQIKNRETLVPIKGNKSYKVRELIREIQFRSPIGYLFVDSWMETITLVDQVKEKAKKNA